MAKMFRSSLSIFVEDALKPIAQRWQRFSGSSMFSTSFYYYHAFGLKEFVRCMAYTFLAAFCLQASGWLYLELTQNTAATPAPWTILQALMAAMRQPYNETAYLFIGCALLIPFGFVMGLYRCARRHDEGRQLKRYLMAIGGILAWGLSSDTILQSFLQRKLVLGAPLDYLHYWLYANAMPQLTHYLVIAGIGGCAPFVLFYFFTLKDEVPNIYGNAHPATKNEIQQAGLFPPAGPFLPEGTFLGRAHGQDLFLKGHEHVILFAPTGSGKTRSLAIPNLLQWQDSCIASDIKLDLFDKTSGYRQSIGQKVFLFNPASPEGKTHRWNPLDMVSADKRARIDEIEKIAHIFMPDSPHSEPIWSSSSRSLFIALALYVLDTPNAPKTMTEILQATKRQENFAAWADATAKLAYLDEKCRNNLMAFVQMQHETRTGVMVSFQTFLALFDNPLVAEATSASDFDIRRLRAERMTVYVGITNDNLVRLAPLLTVFYQQVADVMLRKIPSKDTEPHGVLLLMDEFSALKRMDTFQKNIGLFREYRIKIVLIIQEISQLYDAYGRDGAKVFINSKVRIAYAQNDEETCNLISAATGDKTILVKTRSRPVNVGLTSNLHQTESTHYMKRPLILPQEVRRLHDDKALILIEGMETIFADRIKYYELDFFKQRLLPPVIIKSIFPQSASQVNTVKPVGFISQLKQEIKLLLEKK